VEQDQELFELPIGLVAVCLGSGAGHAGLHILLYHSTDSGPVVGAVD